MDLNSTYPHDMAPLRTHKSYQYFLTTYKLKNKIIQNNGTLLLAVPLEASLLTKSVSYRFR